MKLGIRIVSCVMLFALALTMAVFSLADFSSADDGYTLGEHNGLVAVYPIDGGDPVTITDIDLSQLRQTDRDMIIRGIRAGSREELLSLLEDLGS